MRTDYIIPFCIRVSPFRFKGISPTPYDNCALLLLTILTSDGIVVEV
nr:MAG TPA: hypothetical protein [Caudoviricetes sp.]DAT69708.1 MAG TPA: hypothetical protein [Caudoviricetes sp.]